MQRLDVIGKVYGRLTVISEAASVEEGGAPRRYMNVLCKCGVTKTLRLASLQKGSTTSCGCFRKEATGNMSRTHGQSSTKLYKVWKGMHTRCTTPSASGYEYYGGRGISVCDEWRTFEPFKAWADAKGYEEGLEIDRKVNEENYTPTNCQWVTHQAQCNNRRPRNK